ncbi:DegT/DnrJ/EryC1/StrS family aminotransferase [Streptomyces sp. NPDC057623]|uniref:DegT/DnrJ/EryC1/StrS family aminotransferase n=1 Tax=Streptomyces sp. NPDC057623 TaxID=3346187 RepID=UPI0036952A7A
MSEPTLASATAAHARNARPHLFGDELAAVEEALASGQFGHGPITEQFERDLADFLGVPETVAVASGTAALHIALLAARIGLGDDVVVPSFTFCATVRAIEACGANIRFADIDPTTLCTGSTQIREALTENTQAVLPVLYGGRPVPLGDLEDELAERNITIVEDAAHAFGSYQGPDRVGATGRATCFSFGPIKNLTCGQGGALVPRTREEAERARRIRLLGIAESAARRQNTTTYRVTGPGLRAHLSQINAAIGRAQLPHFPTVQTQRRALWHTYARHLSDLPEAVRLVDVDIDHAVPSLCAIVVDDRDRVFTTLRERGIGAGVHYPPNHLQEAFAAWHRPLPATEHVAARVITLPFHHAMTERDVHLVTTAVKEALR